MGRVNHQPSIGVKFYCQQLKKRLILEGVNSQKCRAIIIIVTFKTLSIPYQGAKKVSFTACHSGKLLVAHKSFQLASKPF